MAVTWKKLAFVEDVAAAYQPVDTQLSSIAALADAAGYLKNDGAGAMSWEAVVATASPDVYAFAADQG